MTLLDPEMGKEMISKGITIVKKYEKYISESIWLKSKNELKEFYQDMIYEPTPFVNRAIEGLQK